MKIKNRRSALSKVRWPCLLFRIGASSTLLLVCWHGKADDPNLFDAETFVRQTRASFAAADRDGDGQLTRDEFLANYPAAEHIDGLRRFLLFDFDASTRLDREEYRAVIAPVDQRGAVPDPIVEMETVALAKWEEIFADADRNHDGALSRREWPAKRIGAEIPVLAELSFDHWDRKGDGKVDRADGRWLLDVTYGLSQLDGRPLRTKTGRVFSWFYFRHLDSDTDGFVSAYEFGIRHNQGKVRNDEIFAELDGDGDGKLSDRETWSLLWHDTIGQFLQYDCDQDGYLTEDEMEAIGWGRSIARHCIPAFDTDQDRRLSFREFRQTTFANPTSAWDIRHDTDRDGRLSWKEFYTEKPPLLIGQYRFLFDRFDRNHDGFLSVREFSIEGDAGQSQLLAFLQPIEQSLPLELAFAKRVCELTGDQMAGLELAMQDVIELLAEKKAQSIQKSTGRYRQVTTAPTPAETALIRSHHLALRREISQWLRDKSAFSGPAPGASLWKELEAERLAAEKRRREAVAWAYVAVVDSVLLLPEKQRNELSDLLSQEAADAWWRPVNSAMFLNPRIDWFFALTLNGGTGGILYGLVMPESELEKKLTPTQWAVFKRSQEPHEQELVIAQRGAPGAEAPGAMAKRPGIARPAQIVRAAPAPAIGVVRPLAQAQVARRVLRSRPTAEELANRLALYVELRLDDIEAACGLSRDQRVKLSMAARLDLARWREHAPSTDEKLDEGEEIVIEKGLTRDAIMLPLAIFRDENSFFQKAIQSRLTDDQQDKLVNADRRRRVFQRQAIVAAVVSGFEQTASLTSAQCQALAAALDNSLDDGETSSTTDLHTECVERIGRIPFERLQPLFYDFQLPAVQRSYAESKRHIEMFLEEHSKQRLAPGAFGGAPRQ